MILMPYTFVPKEKHAKAYSTLRISTKSGAKLCRAISKKPLVRAKRLLTDLAEERRTLGRRHYTKTAKELLQLLNSCEKNAEALGLAAEKLFIHASAHKGPTMRRRRRRGNFGTRLKSTSVEVMLIERGKAQKKADVIRVESKEDVQKAVDKIAERIKEKGMVELEKKPAEAKIKEEDMKTEQPKTDAQ